MKKAYLILIAFILVLPIIFGQLIYKQNIEVDLKIPCFFNGTFCSSSAVCNITIISPNSTALVENGTMTNKISFHNYTLSSTETDEFGEYSVAATCLDQGISDSTTFSFDIAPFGKELSTAQGIIYIAVLIISLVLFGLCFYYAINIPWANTRNLEGRIIHINRLKYLKIFLFFASYLFLIWMSFLMKVVAESYLFIDTAGRIFNAVFWFLITFLFPIIALTFIFIVVLFLQNLKLDKLIQRGIFPR